MKILECKNNFGLTCNGFNEKIKNNIFVFSSGRIHTKIMRGWFLTDTHDLDKIKNINFDIGRLFILIKKNTLRIINIGYEYLKSW